MSTMEKLFVQIFERKNWIIDQVKQQRDLYDQHLASKLLIHGITPPSWLWNPNLHTHSSDPNDLNKEELISELLFPHARPTVPYSTSQCSLYSKPVVTGDNGELLDGLPKEIHASNKDIDARDRLTTVPEFSGNGVRYTSNHVPELDISSTSPHGRIDVRISNIYIEPGQSPAEIQRSPPILTQNSGDMLDGPLMEILSSNKGCDAGNELMTIPDCRANYPGCLPNNFPKRSSQGEADVRILDINTAPDQSLARIHRSKSRQKALELRNSAKASPKIRLSHENDRISFSGVTLYKIDPQESDHANEILNMAESSGTGRGSLVASDAKGGDQTKENGTNSYSNKITRSKNSYKQPSSINEPLNLDGSYEIVTKDGEISGESSVTTQAKGMDQSKRNVTSSYNSRITRSKSSCIQSICLNESMELGGSSRLVSKGSGRLAQLTDSNKHHISGVLDMSIPLNFKNETSGVREAAKQKCDKELGSSKYFGRVTRSRSSCHQPSYVNDSQELHESSYVPKVDSGTNGWSTGKLNQQLDKANEITDAIKPSGKLSCRKKSSEITCRDEGPFVLGVAESRSGATENYRLASSSKKFEENAFEYMFDNKLIQPCPHTNYIVNQEENVQAAVETELVTEGPMEEAHPFCFGSNFDGANRRLGSEGLILRSGSDANMVLKPKQLDCDSMEDCNLNGSFSPTSRKRSPEKSSQRIWCNSSELTTLSHKLSSDYPTNVSLEKQSMGQRDAPSEAKESWGLFEANAKECDENEGNIFGANMDENPLLIYAEDDLQPGVYIHNSPSFHKLDIALSDVQKSFDRDMRQRKRHLAEECPDLHVEEGHLCNVGWNSSEVIPCTLEQQCSEPSLTSNLTKQGTGDPKNCLDKEVDMINPPNLVVDARFNLFDGGLNTCSSVGDPHCRDVDFGCLKLREAQPTNNLSLPEIRSISTKVDSWPQFKRKKVGDHQTNCLSDSPIFRVQKLQNIQEGHKSCYSENVENDSDAVSKFQEIRRSHEGNVNKCSDTIYQNMESHIKDETSSSPKLQIQEGELGFEECNKAEEVPSTIEYEQLGPYLISSLSKKAAGEFQSCFIEDDNTEKQSRGSLGPRNMSGEQKYQQFLHVENNDDQVNSDVLTAERTLLERKSHMEEPGPLSYYSVGSPCNNDLALDQTLPVFEKFVLNEQTDNGEPDISVDGINFGNLDHQSTLTERASILEQICRTASMHSPLSHFSSTYKSLQNQDPYLSVPNGLLERADLRSTLTSSDDTENHLRDTSMDEVDSAFQKVPYSDSRFGWNSKNCYSPYVGKLWERNASNSLSSEKRLSFDPELTCFPIVEDPSVSEENEKEEAAADRIQEDNKREPLSEITDVCLNPPASVSATEKFPHRSSLDSINTEVASTTFNTVKQRLRNHCNGNKSKNWGKENQVLSFGANSIMKSRESRHNRFSKAKVSGKTSMKRGGHRLSEKVKRNNIISNISSFIPLVQQKQAAAVCTGKRDVKVRALEAAEAARRLDEKRENERKMKKEALKLERAKMEQENLRQRELNKRKKEEELKKKDAEIAARKRLREEEEKKEKEKKKRCIEEGWRTHRAQEEKLRAGKGEKEKACGNVGKKMNSAKETDNRSRNDQNVEKESRIENSSKIPENEPKTTRVLASNVQKGCIITEDCKASSDCDGGTKTTSMLDRSPLRIDLATKTSQEKSYDISPYQCSDDEEEQEGDIPTKKFIPSWASKNTLALVLSSQQQIDPCVIFPRERFCSMDEVLLPRNLR